MSTLDFWYDPASTYSYISAMRIERLATGKGVTVRWRPFLLGPIFAAQGWKTSPFNLYPAKGRHMLRDLERLAALHGLPPINIRGDFPQYSVLAARVALLGLQAGWGEDFTRAAFRLEFAEGGRIDDEASIAKIVAALGQDAEAVMAGASSEANKAALKAQTGEAQERGIFGAPTFITGGGELFWGDDRLEQALDWAAKETA